MKITTRFLVSIILAIAFIALATPSALALEPINRNVELLPNPLIVATVVKTNILTINPSKTLKLEPGNNVGVHFNMAGSGASTANILAACQYRTGSGPWSNPTNNTVNATNVLAGTAQVSSTITLTNGVSFPATATELRVAWVTNQSTVTLYLTNLNLSTWQTQR